MCLMMESLVCEEFKVYPITDGEPWKDFKQRSAIISLTL